MTAREYKRMCRIRVVRISKFVTWLCLVVFFIVAEYSGLSGYLTATIGTTIWLYMPDIAIYVLEHLHKLNHNLTNYN